MPIKIPDLQRSAPVAPSSMGRIEAKAPDFARSTAQGEADLQRLGATGVDLMNRFEDDAIDTEANNRTVEYETIFKQKMYGSEGKPGLKFQGGDPTELYKNFDEEMKKEYDRLSAGDMSPRMQAIVQKRLNNTADQLTMTRLSEQGAHQAKWDEQVTTAAVGLKKQGLVEASTFIQPDDPSSFGPFESLLQDIRKTKIRHGEKYNGVERSESGKSVYLDDDGKPVRVNLGLVTDYEVKKELSEGISDAMENLIKSDQIDKAQALKERYWAYLDPVKKKSLADDFQKANVKFAAYDAADKIDKMGVEKATKNLEPEARDKALEIYDDRQRRKENIKDRSSKSSYNLLANHIEKNLRKDPDTYAGVSELENDEIFTRAIGRVSDAKQKKALYDMVVQPKESNDAAIARVQTLLEGNDPEHPDVVDMKPEERQMYLSGLSKTDRRYYERKMDRFASETGAEEKQRYKLANDKLVETAVTLGLVKRDDFNRISGREEIKMNLMKKEFEAKLDAYGSRPMSPKEITDLTYGYGLAKQKHKDFIFPERQKVATTLPVPGKKEVAQVGTIKKDKDGKYNQRTPLQWAVEFEKVKKRKHANSKELYEFIQSSKGP